MILDRFPACRLSPLDQLRAVANLMLVLGDCIAEEQVLRRNGVRITPQLSLSVLAELEVVAGMLDRDLARELLAVRDRFADTATTTGPRRAPNPAVGRASPWLAPSPGNWSRRSRSA
ncbi:hypothetical protein ACFHYO_10705 [Paracoccus panacisoli]|uniref:Uncharacterized protein n=1 Tax=Paracoccus panacisoli TaxID=1510163 RepID=A0ABV6T9C3_9RHOB